MRDFETRQSTSRYNGPAMPLYLRSAQYFDPPNPLGMHAVTVPGLFGPRRETASDRYYTYRWKPKNALTLFDQNELGTWVEEAARIAGRD